MTLIAFTYSDHILKQEYKFTTFNSQNRQLMCFSNKETQINTASR